MWYEKIKVCFIVALVLARANAKETDWSPLPILGDGRLSNGRNWNNGVPTNTDIVSFPTSAEPRDLDNDLVVNDADTFVSLQSIFFGGSGWVLSGRPFAVRGQLSAENDGDGGTSGTEIVAKVITEGGGAAPTLIRTAIGGRLELNALELRGATEFRTESRSFALFGRQHTVIELNGPITGSGQINVSANLIGTSETGGGVEIRDSSGQNTFTGPISIDSSGILRVFQPTSLGSTVGSTSIHAGGSLRVVAANAPFFLDEPLFFNGGELRTEPGSAAATGTLTVRSDVGLLGPAKWAITGPLTITGRIAGSAPMEFSGAGHRVALSGGSANITGPVQTSTELFLNKPAGIDAISSDFTVRSAAAVWVQSNQLADGKDLALVDGGTADLNGKAETVGRLRVHGSGGEVRPGFNGALTVSSVATDSFGSALISAPGSLLLAAAATPFDVNDTRGGADLTVAAAIAPGVAGAGLQKNRSGTLFLTGVCSAPATVRNGILEVTSSSPGMPVTLDQSDGQTASLRGTGTVGAISAGAGGGLVEPAGDTTGILRSGSLAWDDDMVFRTDLRGTAPGTGHDQLSVTGTVNLNGAQLVVDFDGFTPVPGTSFVILSNDGADPISGTFSAMAQGATVLGGRFTISYNGGSGNDVTLTAIAPASGITRTWTGKGANNLWGTAQNWSPTGAPQNGDSLLFPSNTSQRTNSNNLTNLAVQSITISGGPFVLSGNAIALPGGIDVGGTSALGHTINLPLNLTASQAFIIGAQFLSLSGAINTNGMSLAFRINGTASNSSITCSGEISGGAGDQFAKSGDGILVLTGTSTTRGNFFFKQGAVRITNAAALGSRLGSTTVAEDAELVIAGTDLTFNEPVFLAGKITIADKAGTVAITDPIDCTSTAEFFVSTNGVPQVNMFDEVRGVALKKTGPGTMNITGAKTKSLSSGFNIAAGRVSVNGTAGVIALPGDTTVSGILEINQRRVTEPDSRLIVKRGGSVICSSAEIAFAGVTLTGGGISTDFSGFALNGPLEVLPSATTSTLSGIITLPDGPATWTVADGPAAEDLLVTAQLRELVLTDSSLRLSGPGTSTFTANHTLNEIVAVSGGATLLGTSTNTDLLVNGAAVTASGRLRNITVSDGTLAPGPGRAPLTVAEVDFTGGRLECEIDATDSDRLIITGPGDTCDFSGAAEFALLSPVSLPPGTARTIIDVQGGSPVRPFRLHPEASTLIAPGGQRYRINYAAGDGNECTLTALAPAPPPDLRFTGITTTDDLNEGIRSLHLTVSGGEGAIGLGIPFETSTDLIRWSPLPNLLFGDASGVIRLSLNSPISARGLFVRARLPSQP